MIQEHTSQGNVTVDIPNDIKSVIIKMSGGADSSLIAYLFAEFKKNIRWDLDLIAVTLEVESKPYQVMYAKKVIKWINQNLGIEFKDHIYDNMGTSYSKVVNGDDLYADHQWELVNLAYDKHNCQAHVIGVTRNPPIGSLTRHGINQEIEVGERDSLREPDLETQQTIINHGTHYAIQPFVNIDKRAVAEIYNNKQLIKTLYPHTRSCESPSIGDQMQIHCGACWWCAERQWGFGKLI